MVIKSPKRGEIWWVVFSQSQGTKIQKKRPSVIVSNDVSNSVLDRYQVIPLTSNADKVYPSETKISFKNKKGKAMVDQIMTVHRSQLDKKGGRIKSEEMSTLERVIKMQLGL